MRTVRRPQLGLEALEGRDMPRGMPVWTGEVSNDFNNPNNWSTHQMPVADLFFMGTNAQRECVGLTGNWNSITVADNFPFRIVLGANPPEFVPNDPDPEDVPEPVDADPVTTNTLFLNAPAAEIDQFHPWTGAVTPIVVNPAPFGPGFSPAAFTWYAGIINNTQYTSDVTVDDTTMLIAPEEGSGAGEVKIGSDMTLTNAAVGTLYAGIITFLNDAGEVLIQEGAGMVVNPGPFRPTVVKKDGVVNLGPTYTITGSSSYYLLESGREVLYGRLRNLGGRMELYNDTSLFLETPNIPLPAPSYGYLQESGMTILGGGSMLLAAPEPVKIRGGTLTTKYGGGTADAEILGVLEFSGGLLSIDQGSDPHHYGQLTVIGNLLWTGGTFRPCVEDAVDWGQSDRITATGTIRMANDGDRRPNLAPSARDPEDNYVPPTVDRHWELFRADAGITNVNNALVFETPNWAIEAVGDPMVIQWNLRGIVPPP